MAGADRGREMAVAYNMYDVSGKRIAEAPPVAAAKRRRADFDNPSSISFSSFHAHEDGRGETRVIVDTDPIGAAYDFYLQCSKMSPYIGGTSARSVDRGYKGNPVDVSDLGSNPARRNDSLSMTLDGGRPRNSLPPDASRTLFVQGLPMDCTRQEVSHLFRLFDGYQELRLVRKEAKYRSGDPSLLCFVDFVSPAHAAVVKDALQGYKFDELDPHSVYLTLQFARHSAARSGGGYR